MKITIGAYASATRTVPVTFEEGEIVHDRNVNACHDKTGEYDAKATAARVDQVALGVQAKIDLGVITVPAEPEPAPEPKGEPESAPDADHATAPTVTPATPTTAD